MAFKSLGFSINQGAKTIVVYCKCLVSEYLVLLGEGYKDFFIRRIQSLSDYFRLRVSMQLVGTEECSS